MYVYAAIDCCAFGTRVKREMPLTDNAATLRRMVVIFCVCSLWHIDYIDEVGCASVLSQHCSGVIYQNANRLTGFWFGQYVRKFGPLKRELIHYAGRTI